MKNNEKSNIFQLIITILLIIEYFLVRIIFDLEVELSLIQINSFLLSLLVFLLILFLDRSSSISIFIASESTKLLSCIFLFPQIAFLIWDFDVSAVVINYVVVFLTILMFFLPFSEFYLKKE